MPAKLLHRPRDPATRHIRRHERLCGPQGDQILERKQPRLAWAALGRHESRIDEGADGAARQAQELLDVAHAVALHCGLHQLYFLAAFRAAGFAGWLRLAGFFSRLARSASMRSMTCAPASGTSARVIC